MKPTGNHLHVRPILRDRVGSILLTEKLKISLELGRPREWRVLAVGPGRLTKKGVRVPVEAAPGDRVITFHDFEGPVDLPDGTALITETQILAKLPRPTT